MDESRVLLFKVWITLSDVRVIVTTKIYAVLPLKNWDQITYMYACCLIL